jgi:hemolysin D
MLEGVREFTARYGRAFSQAWSARKQMDPPKRRSHELEFLPARLELVENPASPTARWAALTIIAMFCAAVLWASLGKLDIVAVAPGKTIAGGRTKVIQPAETSVVKRILVIDGQHVTKGELLIELDGAAAGAEYQQADESLISAQLAELRYGALLAALDQGKLPPRPEAKLPQDRLDATWLLAGSEFDHFKALELGLRAAIAQREAEQATVQTQIGPLTQSLEISKERVTDLEKLLEGRYVSRHEYLARKQEMVDMERQLSAQKATLAESLSALAGAQEQLKALVTETRQRAYDGLREAREQVGQYRPQVAKTRQRDQLMQLRAPVDGTVQQLAVHTVGGVVTPAQALMAIVPSQDQLEIEATVLNKDIGFVRPGQNVTVKIESFPYTRYGYLRGVVESVSHDAASDEKLGLVFPARIRLLQSNLRVDGVSISMTPGMSLSAEIKTGYRPIIDYLLSPLQETGQEALRER